MWKIVAFKGVLLFASVLLAQGAFCADPGCPVTIAAVKKDTGLGDRITYCFSLEATNTSGKAISELQLHASVVDSAGVVHALPYDYPLANIPSGQSKKGYYSSHRLLGSDYSGIKIWANHVQFADGTQWSDSGQRSCGGQDVKGRGAPKK